MPARAPSDQDRLVRLQGKQAVVTGCASGIGRAVVQAFVEEGAKVTGIDIDDKAGAALSETCDFNFVPMDITKEEDWRNLAEVMSAQAGRLDIVVNNAGIVSGQTIGTATLDNWNRVMSVNVTGAMLGCQFAIKMMGTSGGSIINVGSTASFLGIASDLAYTSSKSAIVGLTRSVAMWCARHGHADIRCNSVHPGPTLTSISERAFARDARLREVYENLAPVKRMADVGEIARMFVFLASDESSYSTGAQFVADGGLTNFHPEPELD